MCFVWSLAYPNQWITFVLYFARLYCGTWRKFTTNMKIIITKFVQLKLDKFNHFESNDKRYDFFEVTLFLFILHFTLIRFTLVPRKRVFMLPENFCNSNYHHIRLPSTICGLSADNNIFSHFGRLPSRTKCDVQLCVWL